VRDTNTVEIQSDNLGECFLFMNDDLLDLDKEVEVIVNGEALPKKMMERDLRGMFYLADSVMEQGRVFTAKSRVVVKSKIVAPPPAGAPNPAPPPDGTKPPEQPPTPPAPTPPAPAPGENPPPTPPPAPPK
jgi:hypothetical protein